MMSAVGCWKTLVNIPLRWRMLLRTISSHDFGEKSKKIIIIKQIWIHKNYIKYLDSDWRNALKSKENFKGRNQIKFIEIEDGTCDFHYRGQDFCVEVVGI